MGKYDSAPSQFEYPKPVTTKSQKGKHKPWLFLQLIFEQLFDIICVRKYNLCLLPGGSQ